MVVMAKVSVVVMEEVESPMEAMVKVLEVVMVVEEILVAFTALFQNFLRDTRLLQQKCTLLLVRATLHRLKLRDRMQVEVSFHLHKPQVPFIRQPDHCLLNMVLLHKVKPSRPMHLLVG
jgi:hypothetical protein